MGRGVDTNGLGISYGRGNGLRRVRTRRLAYARLEKANRRRKKLIDREHTVGVERVLRRYEFERGASHAHLSRQLHHQVLVSTSNGLSAQILWQRARMTGKEHGYPPAAAREPILNRADHRCQSAVWREDPYHFWLAPSTRNPTFACSTQ